MTRPALIFDFGNVVAHFDYARATARLGEPLGVSGTALLERARSLGLNDVVKHYEAGAMTNQQFSDAVCQLIGMELTLDQFALAWGDIFWLNESLAALLVKLKRQGYAMALGSNTNEIHARVFLPQFAETFRLFDALVLSYEVGHIKPSAAFYHACAARLNRPESECIFIDDLAENIEGARAAGLQGVLYTDTPRLIADLGQLGIQI